MTLVNKNLEPTIHLSYDTIRLWQKSFFTAPRTLRSYRCTCNKLYHVKAMRAGSKALKKTRNQNYKILLLQYSTFTFLKFKVNNFIFQSHKIIFILFVDLTPRGWKENERRPFFPCLSAASAPYGKPSSWGS